MKLSEAIAIGSTLRPEGRSGPFIRIANTGELHSDVYGAACEAVHSPIAKRNWNKSDPLSYDADIEALRQVQEKYFAAYFRMPATCPGAKPGHYVNEGVRIVNSLGLTKREGERSHSLPAITTACPAITNLAELIEHMFYVHNWSREECAQSVEWYENQSASLIVTNFEHYQDQAVQQRAAQRLTIAARKRERERRSQRQVYFT